MQGGGGREHESRVHDEQPGGELSVKRALPGPAGRDVSRRLILLAAAAGVVILAAVVAVALHGSRPDGRRPTSARATAAPGSVPPAAASAVRLLVSAGGRAALTPELNSVLRPGRLFPAGTTFTARPGSWHQAGAYANVSGALRVPGHGAERAEIGLVRRGARWLVTFEEKK